jgi:hypothetical protein
MADPVHEVDGRRVALAAMLIALDGREKELPDLLAEADRETLIIAIGGVGIMVSTLVQVVPAEVQAEVRERLVASALEMPGGAPVSRDPDEAQRLLIALLLATHDHDSARFDDLLDGVPRGPVLTVLRNMAETVVGAQVVLEELPGAAREGLASEAVKLAGR